MKLLILFGTRPEAIKLAPIIREARRRASDGISAVVVNTGQHRELLAPVLSFFGIKPDVQLDLMRPDQSLEDFAARALVALGGTIRDQRPDAVVVQGDTTTAMMGALAAFYQRVPVAHVEAGLRTDDLMAPFPEELNRRVIGQMARWHFAPTRRAAEALRRDALPPAGMRDGVVLVTGNTVIDALHEAIARLASRPMATPLLDRARAWLAPGGDRKLVLVTGHRRENFGGPFEEFCLGLRDIARSHPGALIIYPVHLNPNVQRPVRALLSGVGNIVLHEAAEYPEFVSLMALSSVIITDSGGVQEEAPALGIPVLVTRTKTERPEAVESGAVRLVGPDRSRIHAECDAALRASGIAGSAERRAVASPYGDGHAAERCVAALLGESVEEFRADAGG